MTANKWTVPNPCKENLNNMPRNADGWYCKVCRKEVIDFTKMTKEEAENYLRTFAAQNVCGQFKPNQVKQDYSGIQRSLIRAYNRVESKTKLPLFRYVLLFLLGSMLTLSGCEGAMGKVAPSEDTSSHSLKKDSLTHREADTVRTK